MADFPNTIYNPRETENLPGVVYDPANKQNFYSEDFQNLGGEIKSIETLFKNFVDFITVKNNSSIGISDNNPDRPLVLNTKNNPLNIGESSFMIYGENNKERFELRSFGGDPVFQAKRASGNMSNPLASPKDAYLFALGGSGYTGSAFVVGNRGLIGIKASETWSETANGTKIDFEVTKNGTTLRIARMRLLNTGNLELDGSFNYCLDTSNNDDYVASLSVVTELKAGLIVYLKANTANTGSATLNLNSLGAKTIVKRVNTNLANNDILAGMICHLVYDGTNFVLLNPVVS